MARSRKACNRRPPSYQPPLLKAMLEFIPAGLLAKIPCGWQWSAWLLAVTAVLLAWALKTIRLVLRHGPSDHSLPRLTQLLGQAVKDTYLRTAPKKAWNWPHKKTEKPPGPPRIKRASRVEIQLARSLRQHKLVA